MKNSFVLSGGSIKGAFQAGAISEILTSGRFIPDTIYGTSVGSLNGAFIADRAGRAVISGEKPDWVAIGSELQKFWLQEITSFKKIGKKRGKLELLCGVLFNRFNGFIDTSALDKLIRRTIHRENLLNSPVKFYACTVDVSSGHPVYATAQDYPDIHDFIIGSTAIPMVMPLRIIHNDPFVDGGIREVAPLKSAIDDGANQIYCILCQTEDTGQTDFNPKNPIELMDRLMGIMTNETINNDIRHCEEINDILAGVPHPVTEGPLRGKHHVDLKIIRPPEPIDLNLETFTSEKIEKALKYGWAESQKLRMTGPDIN